MKTDSIRMTRDSVAAAVHVHVLLHGRKRGWGRQVCKSMAFSWKMVLVLDSNFETIRSEVKTYISYFFVRDSSAMLH
jgi:hypothetical protein